MMDSSPRTKFNVRDACDEDLDTMTSVVIETFEDDPGYRYTYRYRKEFKTEQFENEKIWLANQLKNKD